MQPSYPAKLQCHQGGRNSALLEKWQLHVVQARVRSTDRHILEKGFQACNGSNPGIPTTLIFGTRELQYLHVDRNLYLS